MIVEIVAQSSADARTIQEAGAHRIELCCALEVGGLTPSVGLVESVRRNTRLEVMAMVRPRSGGFTYSEEELTVIERDIDAVLTAGADGVVTGILNDRGHVDAARVAKVVRAAQGRPVTFHRAFDFCEDPYEALESLIQCGVSRILTGGMRARAADGTDVLRRLVERAGDRIQILAGGGIRAENVAQIVAVTNVREVHLAPLMERMEPSVGRGDLAYSEGSAVDGSEVRRVIRNLDCRSAR